MSNYIIEKMESSFKDDVACARHLPFTLSGVKKTDKFPRSIQNRGSSLSASIIQCPRCRMQTLLLKNFNTVYYLSFIIVHLYLHLCKHQTVAMATTTKAAATSRRGIFMILSPAKTLDLSELVLVQPSCSSLPSCDIIKTRQLADILKSKSKKELKDLLKVSDNISSTVKDYYDAFALNHVDVLLEPSKKNKDNNANSKSAVFSFDGPAFKGISPSTCDSDSIEYMQKYLRIIDPLYGALRPLDLIQPYRLEMASKGILKDLGTDEKSLANWWKSSVTSSILADMKASECTLMVNLASDEYAAAVDQMILEQEDCTFVKVAFQQEGKVIAVHAKKARGLMVKYISENKLESVEGIQQFDLEGYGFCKDRSDETTIVFDRSKNWNDGTGEGQSADKKRKATKQLGKNVASKKKN